MSLPTTEPIALLGGIFPEDDEPSLVITLTYTPATGVVAFRQGDDHIAFPSEHASAIADELRAIATNIERITAFKPEWAA